MRARDDSPHAHTLPVTWLYSTDGPRTVSETHIDSHPARRLQSYMHTVMLSGFGDLAALIHSGTMGHFRMQGGTMKVTRVRRRSPTQGGAVENLRQPDQ